MRKHTWSAIALALGISITLGGCASGVKLDQPPPVEDRTGTNIGALPPVPAPVQSQPAGPGGGSQSQVAPVAADDAARAQPGPANVARIIYFDYDSFTIKPEAQPVIEAHARYLRAANGRHVTVEGHTDERGGREYNLALGQKRAEAVRRALTLLGVPDAQVEAVSFGEEKLAAQGNDEAAHARNRRAELAYR